MSGVLLMLVACTAPEGADTAADTGPQEITAYVATLTTDPAPPQAGQTAQVTVRITDQDGRPIEDLQQSHARMVHTVFVSADLRDFQHLHQEDSAAITAEDLRNATFRFPATFPGAGRYAASVDFAHRNVYQSELLTLDVAGAPAQQLEPDLTLSDTATDGGVTATLRWDAEPYAGVEAVWTVLLAEADGTPVTDLVQWLGADAHVAMAAADLSRLQHSHAWFPGMEDMAPGHEMPTLYPGPDLPFHYVFREPGWHRMWVQAARADAPDDPLVFSFAFEVGP
jgi:hypothetical protein